MAFRWSKLLVPSALLVAGLVTGCQFLFPFETVPENTGGAGGNTGGGGSGAAGGTTTSSTSTGGTTTSGPNCVDPAADCGTPSGECKVFSCVDGECSEGDVADGEPAVTQTDMDCKKNACSGGVVESQDDDTDPLDDGNDCTTDVCDMGAPESSPADLGAPCLDGTKTVCDGNGTCVECIVNADCTDPLEPECGDNFECAPFNCFDLVLNGDETDVDCGGACNGCDTDQDCGDGPDCFHGVCGAGGTCTAPACDDGVQNGGDYLGTNGETDVDCGGPCGPTCGPMKGCDIDGDCVGTECTGAGGTCVPNCLDKVKNNAETDEDCGGGTCGGCAIGKTCEGADANCVGTAYCDVTVCAAKKAPGLLCAGGNQCISTFCTDGVCCNSVCGATCFACDLPGAFGTCSTIAAGSDPDNECNGGGGADVCNGAGACAKVSGSFCAAGSECVSGNCVDGFCCGTSCSGTCEACSNALTGGANGTCTFVPNNQDPNAECVASLSCTGSGSCQPKLAQGAACTVAAECASNNCVDGFCCNNSCAGVCQACSAAKKGSGANGACGSIVGGLDPDNECAGALTCNGAGACFKTDGTTCGAPSECQSNICVDGICCFSTCPAICKACDIAGSLGTCTNVPNGQDPDNECAGPLNCNGAGACQ